MIIVSNTSPISNLLKIGQLPILAGLYGTVIIPPAVHQEILELQQFRIDITLLQTADWIHVQKVQNQVLVAELLRELDLGESEAIALALEVDADRLLIDERMGRAVAQQYGLAITGLLGLLVAAKKSRLILQLKPILDQLISDARFRVRSDLYVQILKDADEA